MLHNLTLGATMSGKTTLNRALCAGLRKRGIKTAVLDPMRDPNWAATFQTHDREAFLKFVRTHERFALFIDESSSALDRYDPRFDWLATTGRHMGHVSHFIAHRLVQLSPTIRAQCMRRWIFSATRTDAKALADEHGEELLGASELQQGEFLFIEPFKAVRRGKVRFGKSPRVTFSG